MKKLLLKIALIAGALTMVPLLAKTAGKVNGMPITVKEANKALEVLTGDKITWDKLKKEEKEQLIRMMAPGKLVAAEAKRRLSKKEKDAALSAFWMQKEMSKIKVSDEEAKKIYNEMVKAAKKAKTKQKIPSFKEVKNSIKAQIAQEKIVSKLMKKAKIKVY